MESRKARVPQQRNKDILVNFHGILQQRCPRLIMQKRMADGELQFREMFTSHLTNRTDVFT